MKSAVRRLFLVTLAAGTIAGCAQHPPAEQRYPVYFQKWSAELDNSAKDVISAAAQIAAKSPSAPVNVLGYADPEGSPQANKDLSALRAQMVSDTLVADGVAPQRIVRQAVGAVDFTLDALESRRVEIVVAKN